ncbi:autophagy-related protein 13-domain-containing protein [Mycena crocata]|nr:autophagy-related protein 13-domain-containing protein [Mycena crocata]
MAGGDSAKADQIAFHIYTKLFHVLHAARASDQGPPSGKTDKWFNLETPLAASGITPTAELDVYRALSAFSTSTSSASQSASSSSLSTASNKSSPSSSSAGPPPPLAIQVLLAVPPPGGGTALVHAASGTRVEPEPRFVLLEEWALAFSPTASTSSAASTASGASTATTGGGGSSSSSGGSTNDEVLPPTIYKNAIPLFRALYALLRILPAWRAGRKLVGRRGGGQAQNVGNSRLRVVVRVRDESSQTETQARATGGRQTQTTMNTGVMGGVGRGMGGGGGNGGMGGAFGASPAPGSGAPPLPTSTHVFPAVPHPAVGDARLYSAPIAISFLGICCFAVIWMDAFIGYAQHFGIVPCSGT